MTLRTYKIELRVDFDVEGKGEMMLETVKMAARHLISTAMLVGEKRKPQIMIESGDMFSPTEEIMLEDDVLADD